MSSRFIMPFADVGSGIKPSSGAKLFFFEIDGVTPKDTYSDQLSTPTPNANPVIADSNGVFGDIYISGKYKVTLQDKNGTQIFGGVSVDELVGLGALINDLSQSHHFETVGDAVNSTIDLPINKTVVVADYAPGNKSGVLYFKVVAGGTGVADGGRYIDLPNIGKQLQQNLEAPFNIKSWGASANSSTAVNNAAFAAAVTFCAERRADEKYRTVFDLGGDTYDISLPIIITISGLTFKNGSINQTVNTNDCMQSDGSAGTIYYLELDNVGLFIAGTSNQFSGANFRHLTGTLGWLKWTGLNSIMNGGRYGFINGYGNNTGVNGNTGGPIWELILDRLWFNNTWSSGFLIPSNGGEPSIIDFDGGSTTYKLSNVHVTNIQSGSPAYRLVNGIDHVILENVTADSCTKFGEFKVKSLIMNNCGMEEIKPPSDATAKAAFYAAPEHNLILVGQQQSFDLTGFTTSWGSELVNTPHSDTAHVAMNSVNSKITGVIGGTVSTGKALRINGGNCTITQNSVVNALPDVVINQARANYQTQQRFVNTTGQNSSFDLFDIDPDRDNVYLISLIYGFSGNSATSTFIVHTSGTAGGLQGNSALLLDNVWLPGTSSITVSGGKVSATVSSSVFASWSAVNLTKL